MAASPRPWPDWASGSENCRFGMRQDWQNDCPRAVFGSRKNSVRPRPHSWRWDSLTAHIVSIGTVPPKANWQAWIRRRMPIWHTSPMPPSRCAVLMDGSTASRAISDGLDLLARCGISTSAGDFGPAQRAAAAPRAADRLRAGFKESVGEDLLGPTFPAIRP